MKIWQTIWSEIKKKWVPFLLCSFIVLSCWLILRSHYQQRHRNDIVAKIENILLDYRFLQRGAVPAKSKIGILAIDDKAIQQFGRYPFSRAYYNKAFANLKKLGVKWIGFDAVYDEPERPSLNDAENIIKQNKKMHKSKLHLNVDELLGDFNALKETSPADSEFALGISEFKNIVMGYFYLQTKSEVEQSGKTENPYEGLDRMVEVSALPFDAPESHSDLSKYDNSLIAYGLFANTDFLSQATDHFGFFSNDTDPDGVVRWVTLVKIINGNVMPSLSLKLASEYMGRDVMVFFDEMGIESIDMVDRKDDSKSMKIPLDPLGEGKILLNHRSGHNQSFRHISLTQAYNNSFTEQEKAFLKGSILLLGATATGINDLRANPFDSMLDGVENHAAALDNIINRDFMVRPANIIEKEILILIVIGVVFSLIMLWSSALSSGIVAIFFLLGYAAFDYYFWFSKGTWVYLGMPFIEIMTLFIAVTMYKYLVEEREKRKVKGAFSHYLSPDVIKEVLDSDNLNLGGVRKECTVFFSDVRGFTTISESLSPEKLSQFMNEYFTPMTKIILDSKGCLDKYIGDAIMAFWGAPIPHPYQADVAAKASVAMLHALDKIKHDFKTKGFPDIDIGIGLNTGAMSVGNMGSDERMAYTVMGDQVNLGARLEGLTKEYGIKIMISEFTVKAFKHPQQHFYRDLDDIRVKGKNEPTKVYELMRPDYFKQVAAIRNLIGEFEQGRMYYRQQKWAEAEKCFLNCLKILPTDGPAQTFIDRIEEYKTKPYIENWDGVYTFKHK